MSLTVFPVQPGGFSCRDEELGTVGVGAAVGHAQEVWFGVLEGKVFILELHAINGFAASAVTCQNVE